MEEFKQERFSDISELHDEFKIVSGNWVFNRFWNPEDGVMVNKVRAGFDDPSLLDDIKFSAKIALNNDPKIPNEYVIFIYGNNEDQENLRYLANKFPYAELIKNTSSTGKSRENSEVEIIK